MLRTLGLVLGVWIILDLILIVGWCRLLKRHDGDGDDPERWIG